MYTRTAGAVQPLVGSGTARHRRPYRSGIPGTDPPSVAAEKPRRVAPFSGAGLFCEPCFLPCPRASPRLPSLLSCAARKKERERERESGSVKTSVKLRNSPVVLIYQKETLCMFKNRHMMENTRPNTFFMIVLFQLC